MLIKSILDEDGIVWYQNNDVTLAATHDRTRASNLERVNDAGKLRGRCWKGESSEGDARMLPGIVIQLFMQHRAKGHS